MTWPSTLAWCAASSAIVAVPLLLRLSAANASASRYKAWWERDSARAITAEAELDLIREQRRAAGRQSHKAERALIAARTEELRRCVAARNNPLEGAGMGVPASSLAREGESLPAPLSFPAPAQQRGKRKDRRPTAETADRTRGVSFRTGATGCDPARNRAAQSIPAETPKQKGTAHG